MMLLPNVDASTIAPMLELHEQYPDCTRVMMGLQPEEVKEDYKAVLATMEKELAVIKRYYRIDQNKYLHICIILCITVKSVMKGGNNYGIKRKIC